MTKNFRLDGLDCANCAAKIENKVSKLDGVLSASVNFMTCKMVLEIEDSKVDEVLPNVKKIVNKIEPDVIFKGL